MKKALTSFIVAALTIAAAAAQEGRAPEPWAVSVSLAANYHHEYRYGYGYADLGDAILAADFLVLRGFGLYAGPRLGGYLEAVCTAAMDEGIHPKPSFGGQVYFLGPTPAEGLKYGAGIAADVLVNLDRIHLQENEPLYLFTEAFLGARIILGENLYLETRAECGFFPAFEDPPLFLKLGAQLGLRLE